MKHNMYFLMPALILLLFLSSCMANQENGNEQTDPITESQTEQLKSADPGYSLKSKIDILENRSGEYVFSISSDEFVEEFNVLFRNDNGHNFFPEKAQWQTIHYDSGIHSDYKTECRTFKEDPNLHVLPTISVYVPTNTNQISEVSVNFDWHSYTEGLYTSYEEMCFFTLKIFFPTLSDEKIHSIYKELNSLADANVYSSDQWYGHGAVPCTMYFKDQIGVYSYFAIGDWMYLCIIPVTENLLDIFHQKGVELHEMQ